MCSEVAPSYSPFFFECVWVATYSGCVGAFFRDCLMFGSWHCTVVTFKIIVDELIADCSNNLLSCLVVLFVYYILLALTVRVWPCLQYGKTTGRWSVAKSSPPSQHAVAGGKELTEMTNCSLHWHKLPHSEKTKLPPTVNNHSLHMHPPTPTPAIC